MTNDVFVTHSDTIYDFWSEHINLSKPTRYDDPDSPESLAIAKSEIIFLYDFYQKHYKIMYPARKNIIADAPKIYERRTIDCETFESIAKDYGVTKERIRQICFKCERIIKYRLYKNQDPSPIQSPHSKSNRST